jgi:hypothetical protein
VSPGGKSAELDPNPNYYKKRLKLIYEFHIFALENLAVVKLKMLQILIS